MTNAEHEKLAEALHDVEGAVAVSGYRCNLMDRLHSIGCVSIPRTPLQFFEDFTCGISLDEL